MATPTPGNADLRSSLTTLLRLLAPSGVRAATDGQPGADEDRGTSPSARLPELSASEARALIELAAARGIAQGELAALLGLEKSTVSRLAVGLERKGWVSRGRDAQNQRYVRVYLTAEGRHVAERVWRAWQTRQARILATLSDEERAGLIAGLSALVRGLSAEQLPVGGITADGPGSAHLAGQTASSRAGTG